MSNRAVENGRRTRIRRARSMRYLIQGLVGNNSIAYKAGNYMTLRNSCAKEMSKEDLDTMVELMRKFSWRPQITINPIMAYGVHILCQKQLAYPINVTV